MRNPIKNPETEAEAQRIAKAMREDTVEYMRILREDIQEMSENFVRWEWIAFWERVRYLANEGAPK